MADAEAPQAEKDVTEYMVLREVRHDTDESKSAWVEVGPASGHTKESAMKALFGENAPKDRVVAVPLRSWTPKTPKTRTEVITTFE